MIWFHRASDFSQQIRTVAIASITSRTFDDLYRPPSCAHEHNGYALCIKQALSPSMHIDYLTPLLHYKLRYRYGIEQLIQRPCSNLITKLLVPITNEILLAIYVTFCFIQTSSHGSQQCALGSHPRGIDLWYRVASFSSMLKLPIIIHSTSQNFPYQCRCEAIKVLPCQYY